MKRRQKLLSSLAFVTAIGLLSLPLHKNIAIRNTLAEKACPLWQVDDWLSRTAQKKNQAQERARSSTKGHTKGHYLVGKVLFRALNSYNSSMWIDIGSTHAPLLAKNSPVLSGDSLVGLVEYVGRKMSLVRLITDSSITPSVRVARHLPDKQLMEALLTVRQALETEKILFSSENEEKALIWLLESLSNACQKTQTPLFLAKGTVQGYGESLWRAPLPILKGSGFNYDFKDSYGPARDLRTGAPHDPKDEYTPSKKEPLVQVGDLLITTGMDGVFPEGLRVARVQSIVPLSEGAYAYDLFAVPTAEDLLDLEYVTVLPPQGFEVAEIPQRIDRLLEQLAPI